MIGKLPPFCFSGSSNLSFSEDNTSSFSELIGTFQCELIPLCTSAKRLALLPFLQPVSEDDVFLLPRRLSPAPAPWFSLHPSPLVTSSVLLFPLQLMFLHISSLSSYLYLKETANKQNLPNYSSLSFWSSQNLSKELFALMAIVSPYLVPNNSLQSNFCFNTFGELIYDKSHANYQINKNFHSSLASLKFWCLRTSFTFSLHNSFFFIPSSFIFFHSLEI